MANWLPTGLNDRERDRGAGFPLREGPKRRVYADDGDVVGVAEAQKFPACERC